MQNVVTYDVVVLSAANPENLLLPGMTALVRITVNRTGPVLKVPLAALRFAPKAGQGRRGRRRPRSRTASPRRSGSPARMASRSRSRSASARTTPATPRSSSGPLARGDRVIVGESRERAPRGSSSASGSGCRGATMLLEAHRLTRRYGAGDAAVNALTRDVVCRSPRASLSPSWAPPDQASRRS